MLSKSSIALLLTFFLLFSACKKANTAGPSYTAKMGGVRNWHGSHYYHAQGLHFPTPVTESYAFPDTSFALVIIDGSTIKYMNETLKYDRTDTARQIYFFGGAYYYYTYNSEGGIAYYYAKDSIVHCYGDLHGTSDSWILQDLYYTY